jgi:hypothetical protein
MSKGKRYILVEVDVEECDGPYSTKGSPGLKGQLSSDSQQSFDSILAELERLSYADGTRVYSAMRVHEHTQQVETLQCLHELACEKGPAPHYASKECDRPSLHLRSVVEKRQYASEHRDAAPGLSEGVDY